MREIVDGAVRALMENRSAADDEALAGVRSLSEADGIRPLDASSARFLHLLARAMPARRILEIGTGYAYSCIQLARAMPQDGVLFTFELNPERAAIARRHVVEAGLANRANVMVGDATRLLHKVAGPFDLIFQDADQAGFDSMLERVLALLRPDGVLISRRMRVSDDADPGPSPASAQADRATSAAAVVAGYNRRLAADQRLLTMILPIGGGLVLSVRRDATPQDEAPHER
jgi:caffeoyl-CoA O-methyltransferase